MSGGGHIGGEVVHIGIVGIIIWIVDEGSHWRCAIHGQLSGPRQMIILIV